MLFIIFMRKALTEDFWGEDTRKYELCVSFKDTQFLLTESALKNHKKCFLRYLKSSFRSQDI